MENYDDDSNEEVILLNFWASFYGMRVKIALGEKGIKYECKEEQFPIKTQLLLETNPVHKKVPVLIHNGKPVCESLAILEYINEAWKDHNLLPSNPYDKSQARFWAQFIDRKLFNDAGRTWKLKGEEQEIGKRYLIHSFGLLEKELGEKTYFGGEFFGYLDIALISYASWFYTYEKFGNFSMEAVCPKLFAWVKRCMKRESVANSLEDPLKIYEFAARALRIRGPSTIVHS